MARADNVNGLLASIASWGVPAEALKKTIADYGKAVAATDKPFSLDAPIGGNGTPHKALAVEDGPFWALEVQPLITFSYGGAKVDTSARTLTQDGVVIPGLYTIGMDGGGFSNWRYCGGLALAFVTGRWGAIAALRDQGLLEGKRQERANL